MKKKILIWGSALLVTGLVSAQAAQRGPYMTLEAGANWIPNFDASFATPGGPEAEAEIDLDTGFRGDLAVGYNFNRFLGVELQSGFLWNEAKDVDAWLGQVPLLANVILRYENTSRLVPFIGAGAGGVAAILDLEEGDADESDSDIVFAWQLQGGIRYKFNEQSSFGVVYKYMGVDAPEFSLGASDQDFDTYHNHAVLASFNFSF